MKLINVNTREVEEFDGVPIPPYAILSHTWGPEEVTLADMEALNTHRRTQEKALSSSLSSPSFGSSELLFHPAQVDKGDAMRLMLLANMLMAFRGGQSNKFQRASPYAAITSGYDAHLQDMDDDTRSHRSFVSTDSQPRSPHSHPVERKAGYPKIEFACGQAAKEGYTHVWVDTCCIDRKSSGEVTEAINSMFSWYQKAAVCYAYLDDVNLDDYTAGYRTWNDDFNNSRWFTRGWTLQELLAPRKVVFYAKGWRLLGTKSSLVKNIQKITKIDELTLLEPRLIHNASVAQRMSWASKRSTTRTEDIAYCLFGIFGINLPIIYGEGERAFLRLQEEIIKRSDDHSIFAWGTLGNPDHVSNGDIHPTSTASDPDEIDFDELSGTIGILARSPADFEGMEHVVVSPPSASNQTTSDHTLTNKGLFITLPVVPVQFGHASEKHYLAVLNCQSEIEDSPRLGLLLTETASSNVLLRTKTRKATLVSAKDLSNALPPRQFYIPNNFNSPGSAKSKSAGVEEILLLKYPDLIAPGYDVLDVQAKHSQWNREFSTLRVSGMEGRALYQLCVITFWNKHMRCGFVVRVLVDGATRTGWVDLVQPESGDNTSLEGLVGVAKRIWEQPGRVEVSAGKKSVRVEVVNPVQWEEEEQDGQGRDRQGRRDRGVSVRPGAEIKRYESVTFVEKWERDYMRTVTAKMTKLKNKGVMELSMSSMLWMAAPPRSHDLDQPS
ncbi:vegetative incompatibility protein HET-E-1 [Cladorrhinum sp. PSN259]|nr:vegetative incompatibility protein HET-E-1 [Cladorrhinum sp. PSN259]